MNQIEKKRTQPNFGYSILVSRFNWPIKLNYVKQLQLILLSFAILFLASCNLNKNMVCFKDLHSEQNQAEIILQDTTPNYRLRVHDILYVNIVTLNPEVNQLFNPSQGGNTYSVGTSQNYGDQVSQYLNGYEVNSKGKITLPILGTIEVKGMTLSEAQEKVEETAGKFLKDANVKVRLLSFKVTVLGEVASPGVYYNFRNNLTVLDAISMARGLTDYARLKNVLVIRQVQTGKQTYYIDLSSKHILDSKAYYLQPNDVVYIEPEKFKRARVNSSLYSVMLSGITTLFVVFSYLK